MKGNFPGLSSNVVLATLRCGNREDHNMSYNRLPTNTPTILRNAGLTVVEVDGWKTRGRPASTGGFNPKGVLCHHTATGPSSKNDSVVKLLVNGRSDLPGPLCQFGLGRDGTVYLVASGRANHAGKAKQSTPMPAGDGNDLYYGIEAFNNGVGEKWSEKQMTAYALLCAVLCVKFTKNGYGTVRGHKETSVTGKIDPTFSMPDFRKSVEAKIKSLTVVKPLPSLSGPKAPLPAPSKWGDFKHLDSSKFMDYYYAIVHNKAVDVDAQNSKQGTAWGAHWQTLSKLHVFDPLGKIKQSAKLNQLTDAEIGRLRSKDGKRLHRISDLLRLAWKHKTRVELELKSVFSLAYMKRLMAVVAVKALHNAKLLQVKTLAAMAGSITRLRPAQQAGYVTVLSFTDYKGKGISKANAWPEVDYTRGTPKWVA